MWSSDRASSGLAAAAASSPTPLNDFTVNKLAELNLRMTSLTNLTKCPGIPAYMSPETLSDPPVYTEKLDCFQAGVLMIQTITRKFPNPSDATRKERFPRSPTGWVNIPVPEAERRHNHLSLIPRTHPIFPIATDCLKDKDTERLSAQQICHRLSALKEAPQYGQSLEARGGERDGEVQERELLIQQLRQENEEREREVRVKEGEIGNLRDVLQRTEEEKQKLSRSKCRAYNCRHQSTKNALLIPGREGQGRWWRRRETGGGKGKKRQRTGDGGGGKGKKRQRTGDGGGGKGKEKGKERQGKERQGTAMACEYFILMIMLFYGIFPAIISYNYYRR